MTLSLKFIVSSDVLDRRAIKREWQMRKQFSGRFEFVRSRLALLLLLCLPAVLSSFLHLQEPSRQQVRLQFQPKFLQFGLQKGVFEIENLTFCRRWWRVSRGGRNQDVVVFAAKASTSEYKKDSVRRWIFFNV
jgi:hypothetical protein